jgi:hypothetical protein
LEENIIAWLQRISEKKDELGGFSICPFARKAMNEKKIFWSYINHNAETYILNHIKNCFKDVIDFEVILYYNVEKNLSDSDLLTIISNLQKERTDLIFLKDHPDNPGYINGLYTGNGEYPVILVQPKNKLLEARSSLEKTNYYSYWSEEYKKEIWSYGDES